MSSMERAGGAGRGRWHRREILQFIRGFTQREGYPPTLREIGEAVGLARPPSPTTGRSWRRADTSGTARDGRAQP